MPMEDSKVVEAWPKAGQMAGTVEGRRWLYSVRRFDYSSTELAPSLC